MEKFKILSGEEVVAKGATKSEVVLPEIGLKDVTPDGSWLEQKQIQSALEARKQLVEAQRIEKSGVLSHAEWRDDLKLAEVTQLAGGHWQFLGHHRDRKLYLRPEEALFLIEVNCLQLKYSDVTVSLQQAYSLLLSDDITITQYKVYSSLSRLGYKVFKHSTKPDNKKTSIITEESVKDSIEENIKSSDNNLANSDNKLPAVTVEHETKDETSMEVENQNKNKDISNNELSTKETEHMMEIETQTVLINEKNQQGNEKQSVDEFKLDDSSTNSTDKDRYMTIDKVHDNTNESSDVSGNSSLRTQMVVCDDNINNIDLACSPKHKKSSNIDPLKRYCQWKLKKLTHHQENSHKTTDVHKYFEFCPDLLENKIVSVKVPKEEFIPRNIFLNNLTYVLNVDKISQKNNTPAEMTQPVYTIPDGVNCDSIPIVTDTTVARYVPRPQNTIPSFLPQFRQNMPFRHFGFFRPSSNTHYFQFNVFYQKPFQRTGFDPRFQFYPRPPTFSGFPNNSTHVNDGNSPHYAQKRGRDSPKTLHFKAIKNLTLRLRQLHNLGNVRPDNIQALQRILDTYNERYRAQLRLTGEYEVVNDETIVDTIELVDDDESTAKRPRFENKSDLALENLKKIRQIADQLKILEAQNKTSTRHRRALSSLIKTFNKSFNADIYVNDAFVVLDRRLITLDSDSDSDCVVEVNPTVPGKKLRNPFNILKRLSEKQVGSATTSRQESAEPQIPFEPSSYNSDEMLRNVFEKAWLPAKDDFGRAEVIPRDTMRARLIVTKKAEYLLDFYKNESSKYDSWVDIKIAFIQNIEDTNVILETEAMMDKDIDLRSLVRPDDCTDMSVVLKKLRIIKVNKDVKEECPLAVDFDVYNRDVSNFRKTCPPKPHFRIVCIDETAGCPPGVDVATLQSKYDDNVAILFAVVGVSSISYLQMLPSDLPVYIPSNDLG